MPRFRLHHRHTPDECAAAFASWRGFTSPLRQGTAVGSCLRGGHEVWWDVDAVDDTTALALLPPFVAARTDATRVQDLPIP